MADENDDTEKTEDPTQKRLDEALERGDVVKSQEVNTWFIMAGATLVLMAFSGGMGASLSTTMRGLIANSYQIRVDATALPHLYQTIGLEMLAAMAVPVLLLMLAALAGNMIQHRLVWSTEALAPKLSKISPMAGAQAPVLHAGGGQSRQGHHQDPGGGRGAHRADVARARTHHGPGAHRSGGDPAARPHAGAQAHGRGGRHAGGDGRRRLTCSSTGAGTKSRRCRCAKSRRSSSSRKAIRPSRAS